MANAQVQEYTIDPAASVFSFKVEHFGVATVNGTFSSASGRIHYDALQPDSLSAQISIDVESIDTSNSLRDKELRSEDFLDVRRYPTVSFLSLGSTLDQRATVAGGSRLSDSGAVRRLVKGSMTLYGNTREIEIPVELKVSPNGSHVTIYSDFILNRKDFGLKFGILMDSLVGDEIRISVSMVGQLASTP